MRSLQDFKKISILEVRGYCYGWHFYQAADADIVLASEDALFGHAAFRYAGLAARQWQWCSMMGLRKFMEMVFTGRPFTAKEMYDCDFVNAVVPFDELEAMTREVRARLRPHPAHRHRVRPEDLLRDLQAAPGRVHGQHHLRHARVDGLDQLRPDPGTDGMELDREDAGPRPDGHRSRTTTSDFPPTGG